MLPPSSLVLARTVNGRPFRLLTLLDEYSRECLALLVERRISSEQVFDRLYHLFLLVLNR